MHNTLTESIAVTLCIRGPAMQPGEDLIKSEMTAV